MKRLSLRARAAQVVAEDREAAGRDARHLRRWQGGVLQSLLGLSMRETLAGVLPFGWLL